MAKIRKIYDQTIKPDGSKTTIYPITSTRAVYTPEGETLDSYLKDGYFHGADLRGYKTVSNVTDLPTTENQFGWLIGEDLYVWVGTGGDTLGGLYQNCGHFRTPYVPDDEDLAADSNNELKLKDRTVEDDGMGYVILRKNKTFAEQVIYENTIYEIRYDFDLDGGSVAIPAGCVLKFNGGKITGACNLTVNNVKIDGTECFSTDVVLKGVCKNDEILVDWFVGEDVDKINCACAYAQESYFKDSSANSTSYMACYKTIVFGNEKEYLIDGPISLPYYCKIKGNNSLLKSTASAGSNMMQGGPFMTSIEDLTFIGDNVCGLYLNVGNLDGSFTTLRNLIFETKNVSEDTELNDKNYAIYLYNISSQCLIERCVVRQAPKFLKVRCDSLTIRDCWVNGYSTDIAGWLKPNNTCSIELSEGVRYTRIENCQFIPERDPGASSPVHSKNTRWIDLKGGQISISNCIFGSENSGLPIIWKYTDSTQIGIYDSQVGCGGDRNYAGIVTLMKNISIGSIVLQNVSWEYSRPINPYGFVMDRVSFDQYISNTSYVQEAFDAMIDHMVAQGTYKSASIELNNVLGTSDYYKTRCLFPFIKNDNKGYINNFDTSKTYAILNKNEYSSSIGNYNVCLDSKIEIVVSGKETSGGGNGYPFVCKFDYEFLHTLIYNLNQAKIQLVNSIGCFNGNSSATASDLNVSLVLDGNDVKLTIVPSGNASGVDIRTVTYTCKTINAPSGLYTDAIALVPQKCVETFG